MTVYVYIRTGVATVLGFRTYIYVRTYERVKGDNESRGNRRESPGTEVEVVWACYEKGGALRRKEGDGNESTGRTKRGIP